jgi:signal transduction histidine kinase
MKYVGSMSQNMKLPRFVFGDADRLQQVAVNVIQNAIQFS